MTPSPVDQLVSINSQIVQYIEVLVALGAVLAVAYVALRMGLPRVFGMTTLSGGPIQVLSRYVLTPKNTLYLVKTGSQVFLIAASEGSVNFLTAIAPDNIDEVLASQRAANAPQKTSGFAAWLRKGEKDR